MNEIEKAIFAMKLTSRLCEVDQTIVATSLIRDLYKCRLFEAKDFVEAMRSKWQKEHKTNTKEGRKVK